MACRKLQEKQEEQEETAVRRICERLTYSISLPRSLKWNTVAPGYAAAKSLLFSALMSVAQELIKSIEAIERVSN